MKSSQCVFFLKGMGVGLNQNSHSAAPFSSKAEKCHDNGGKTKQHLKRKGKKVKKKRRRGRRGRRGGGEGGREGGGESQSMALARQQPVE